MLSAISARRAASLASFSQADFAVGSPTPKLQYALGLKIQVVHQRAFPVCPQVRVGGINIGDGEYIEMVEMNKIADVLGKFMDNIWVGGIFAL